MKIEQGDPLIATTATGERIDVIAMGRPVRGRDFPLVWVAMRPEDVERPERWRPWPLGAIELARGGSDYAAAINAPLSAETIEALAAKLKTGEIGRRKVRRRPAEAADAARDNE